MAVVVFAKSVLAWNFFSYLFFGIAAFACCIDKLDESKGSSDPKFEPANQERKKPNKKIPCCQTTYYAWLHLFVEAGSMLHLNMNGTTGAGTCMFIFHVNNN